jgi:hypothetical protein
MPKRLVWALLALLLLFLIFAPLASYCLGREEDYRDKGELRAPAPVARNSAVVTGPRIR